MTCPLFVRRGRPISTFCDRESDRRKPHEIRNLKPGSVTSRDIIVAPTALGSAVGLGVAWFATAGMPADRIERSDRSSRPMMASIAPTQHGAMLAFGGE